MQQLVISLDAGQLLLGGGALTLEGKTGININEDGSIIIAISDNRGIATTNTGTIDLDCSSTLNLNSTGGAISIGNDDILIQYHMYCAYYRYWILRH